MHWQASYMEKHACQQFSMEKHGLSLLGARLKEERERVALTQALLAAHGGVKTLTQGSYEGGKSFPNAEYLAKIAGIGIDVLYVVTGQRTPVRQHVIVAVEHDDDEVVGRPVLSLDERAQLMLSNYMASDDEGRRTIEGTALLGAKSVATKRSRRASGGQ